MINFEIRLLCTLHKFQCTKILTRMHLDLNFNKTFTLAINALSLVGTDGMQIVSFCSAVKLYGNIYSIEQLFVRIRYKVSCTRHDHYFAEFVLCL